MLATLGVYFAADITLALAALFLLRRRLPEVRTAIRTFLEVPSPCSHACSDEDYLVRRKIYEELTGESYDDYSEDDESDRVK